MKPGLKPKPGPCRPKPLEKPSELEELKTTMVPRSELEELKNTSTNPPPPALESNSEATRIRDRELKRTTVPRSGLENLKLATVRVRTRLELDRVQSELDRAHAEIVKLKSTVQA